MDPEFASRLSQLEADLRAGNTAPAALFWLKTFVDMAVRGRRPP